MSTLQKAMPSDASTHSESESLQDLLERMNKHVQEVGQAQVGEIVDQFNDRSFGPILVLIGVIAASPVGAIPGIPAFLAIILLFFISQNLIGMKHIWLPSHLEQRYISAKQFDQAVQRAMPWAKRIDRVIQPRLTPLVQWPMNYVLAILAALLAISMGPLELIPFAVFVPALGITAIGLAKVAKDGLLALTAYALSAGVFYILFAWGPDLITKLQEYWQALTNLFQ